MALWITYISILAVNGCLWLGLSYGLARARKSAQAVSHDDPEATSIVVAVKNEEGNIDGLLDCLLGQDHPDVEIIISDDGSTDSTLNNLKRHPRSDQFTIVESIDGVRGKKHALNSAIAVSGDRVLLFTDADCRPAPHWASTMSGLIRPEGDRAVVGYSPFRRAGGFTNRLFRYETFLTGFLTAAAVGIRRPYMAVGRNFAYTRGAFNSVGGFDRIMRSMSGDDDLLVQQFADSGIEVLHAFGSASYVETESPSSLGEWARQKMRHTSAGRFYSTSAKMLLALFHGTGLVLYTAPLLLGSGGSVILAVGILVQWLTIQSAGRVFEERDVAAWQPVFHVLYSLYNVTLAPLGLLRKPRRW